MAVEGIDDQFLHSLWCEAMFQDYSYHVMLTMYLAGDLDAVNCFHYIKIITSLHVHALLCVRLSVMSSVRAVSVLGHYYLGWEGGGGG